ncbi:MAG: hypothetical protein M0031_14550 [Thermaerobacter sp.]|jgi:hypothetical protein|nr:hypothetical protein [Thermaerobacter sp.]
MGHGSGPNHKKGGGLNVRAAVLLSNAVQSMLFFWICLGGILVLHVLHPTPAKDLLLQVENDLQLLLLPILGISGAVTQAKVNKVLAHLERGVGAVKREVAEEERGR